jgi:hypothetical protein
MMGVASDIILVTKIGQMGKCRISIIIVILMVNFVVLVQMRCVHVQNVSV